MSSPHPKPYPLLPMSCILRSMLDARAARPGLPSRAAVTRFGALLAPVAQLDRAPDYESGGRRFESFRARHAVLLQTRCRDWALESAALPRFSRAIARRTGRRDSPNREILAPSARQSLSSETRPPLRPRTGGAQLAPVRRVEFALCSPPANPNSLFIRENTGNFHKAGGATLTDRNRLESAISLGFSAFHQSHESENNREFQMP